MYTCCRRGKRATGGRSGDASEIRFGGGVCATAPCPATGQVALLIQLVTPGFVKQADDGVFADAIKITEINPVEFHRHQLVIVSDDLPHT